jgi:hypothetical protein
LMPPDARRGLYWLRALGRKTLPEVLHAEDREYRLVETIKHDFYAATGLYRTASGVAVILKVNRNTPCGGLPMTWLGRRLRDREVGFYRKFADQPGIPGLVAVVGDTGFVHAFIPGQPLSDCRFVPNGFFDRLLALFGEIHGRGAAYVDSHKTQNIIVGADGEPYLVDFQISLDLATAPTWLARRVVTTLQRIDIYHALKHKSRHRPDELTDVEAAIVQKKSLLVRVHRIYTTPYQKALAWLFRRWEQTGRLPPSGSE